MTKTTVKRPPRTTIARLLQVGDVIAQKHGYYRVTAAPVVVRDNWITVAVDVLDRGENYPATLNVGFAPDFRVSLGQNSKRWTDYREARRVALLAIK